MSTENPTRGLDVDRTLTFVDAAVAIALTLLVLPLVDLAGDILRSGEDVGKVLGAHYFDFISFALSFAVIARLWVVQHRVVRDLRAGNALVYALLMAWTFTVVFLPFPTTLLAAQNDDRLVHALYIGTVTLSMFVLAALSLVLVRTPGLRTDGAAGHLAGTITNSVLLVVALILSVAFPVVGYYPMLLLALDGRVETLARRVRRRR